MRTPGARAKSFIGGRWVDTARYQFIILSLAGTGSNSWDFVTGEDHQRQKFTWHIPELNRHVVIASAKANKGSTLVIN